MFLCNIEGKVEVVQRVILGELGVVQEVWPVSVDECTEGQAILRERRHVVSRRERERGENKNPERKRQKEERSQRISRDGRKDVNLKCIKRETCILTNLVTVFVKFLHHEWHTHRWSMKILFSAALEDICSLNSIV